MIPLVDTFVETAAMMTCRGIRRTITGTTIPVLQIIIGITLTLTLTLNLALALALALAPVLITFSSFPIWSTLLLTVVSLFVMRERHTRPGSFG